MRVTVIFFKQLEPCGSVVAPASGGSAFPGVSSMVLVQRDLTIPGVREDLGDV